MTQKKRVVVLGAGMAGLSAAYRLSKSNDFDVHVIETQPVVGGAAGSFTDGEFTLDYGPHKFYSLIDGVMDELRTLMGEDLLEREKTQSIFLRGKYFSFPLKMSDMLLKFPPTLSMSLGGRYFAQLVCNLVAKKKAKSYKDYVIERFGKGLYRLIFEPMATKIFGDPERLDRKLAEVRISSSSLLQVMKQLVAGRVDKTVSAKTFLYPKLGFGMIPKRLHLESENHGAVYHLGNTVTAITTQNGRVTGVGYRDQSGVEQRLSCDFVVYTIPLSLIDSLFGSQVPASIRQATRFISYRHALIHYFLIKKPTEAPILPSMWVFFPESEFRFGRLSEMEKFSPHTTPNGYTALMADFTCETSDSFWDMDDTKLGEELMRQMEPLALFKKESVIRHFSKRIKNFYPVYNVGFEQHVRAIRTLEEQFSNLFFIGRVGDFNYNNCDQCLDMGFKVSDHVRKCGEANREWQDVREQRFEKYRIVD